jgi:hypothetical protein
LIDDDVITGILNDLITLFFGPDDDGAVTEIINEVVELFLVLMMMMSQKLSIM